MNTIVIITERETKLSNMLRTTTEVLNMVSAEREAALQDRVSLAMQVESLTKNLDGHKIQADEDFALIARLTAENNALRAELDKLKKQEPVALVTCDPMWGVDFTKSCGYGTNLHVGAKLYLAAGAQPAEIEALRADAERLDFVLDRCAFIAIAQLDHPGVRYQCMIQDEDENYHILSGEHKSFATKREAVDAAKAAS